MYGKIRADNFFYTTLAAQINATDTVGTFELTSKTVNGYTIEDGDYMFWMIVGLNDPATAEIFRVVNVNGTILTYDKRISPTGTAIHAIGTLVNMQSSSDYINWLSNNTNDLGYTETVAGTGNELKVKVYGGRIENPSAADIVVSDTTLTLTANTTHYVYFDDSDNTIKSSTTEPETYKVFAKVTTGVSAVTSIEDYRAEKIIMGAVPLSLSQTDINSLTNVRPGTVVYNETTGENQQYIGGSWFPIAAGSTQPRATETIEGKVRIATDVEYAAGTEIGTDGASLVPTPGQIHDGFVAISSGAADEGKSPQLNSAGKLDNGFIYTSSFGGTGADGAVSDAALTITGSNNTYIVKNYTSWPAGSAPRICTITPTNCILHIKVSGNVDLTNWTFNFDGKGGPGAPAHVGAATTGTNGLGSLPSIITGSATGKSGGGGTLTAGYGGGTSRTTGPGLGGLTMSPAIVNLGDIKFLYIANGAGGGSGRGNQTTGTLAGAGGNGGGCIIFEIAGDVNLGSSVFNLSGTNGGNGANAGGSYSNSEPGGGGGGGALVLLYKGLKTGNATINVSGGLGGAPDGEETQYGGNGGLGTYRIGQSPWA